MPLKPQSNKIIVDEIRRSLGKAKTDSLSQYELAKGSWRLRKIIRRRIREVIFMLLGILSAGFGLKGFLLPGGFIDGGVMGISLLTNRETLAPLSLLIIVFNLPFILIGWKQINPTFSIKSIIAISLLALAVTVFPYPAVTNDKLLVSVFRSEEHTSE